MLPRHPEPRPVPALRHSTGARMSDPQHAFQEGRSTREACRHCPVVYSDRELAPDGSLRRQLVAFASLRLSIRFRVVSQFQSEVIRPCSCRSALFTDDVAKMTVSLYESQCWGLVVLQRASMLGACGAPASLNTGGLRCSSKSQYWGLAVLQRVSMLGACGAPASLNVVGLWCSSESQCCGLAVLQRVSMLWACSAPASLNAVGLRCSSKSQYWGLAVLQRASMLWACGAPASLNAVGLQCSSESQYWGLAVLQRVSMLWACSAPASLNAVGLQCSSESQCCGLAVLQRVSMQATHLISQTAKSPDKFIKGCRYIFIRQHTTYVKKCNATC